MKRGIYGLQYHELTRLYFEIQELWSKSEFLTRKEVTLNGLLDSISKVFIFLQERN